uniref:Uncharacterized protein n=1 Tax=Arundo donax TaxID=35708 RepID=A0A0A8Z5E0_ARUDO
MPDKLGVALGRIWPSRISS